jgi:uncharacterized protein DUF4019
MFVNKEEAMKIVAAVFVVALFALTAPLAASAEEPEIAAESVALAWLRLLDAGSYTQSWSAASTLFRERTSQSRWRAKIATGRGVLGPLVSRNLQSAVLARTVRGEPDGEYTIVRFSSRFAWMNNEQTVFETVVTTKDADGIWRVADFYIPYIPYAE